jgi:hypothetical protein
MSIFLVLLLILMGLVVFFMGVLFMMTQYKRIMLYVCLVFVTIGFLLYTAGYLSSGEGFAYTLLAALRGLFSTARIFSVNDDYGFLENVQETQWLTHNTWIQILFWLCHLSVVILIQVALISLFGRKLIDNFRLRFGLHSDVYIIKGCDKNALLLGENIATQDGLRKWSDTKRLVIFLLGEDDDEKKTYEKVSHFGGVVALLDNKNDLPYYLKKTGLGKRSLQRKKYKIILMPNTSGSVSDNAQIVAEFAQERNVDSESLDIFALTLSEWEREKIEAITQAKEGGKRKYPFTFHIINEVDLLVRQMINKNPPFECPGLNFDGKGIAARNFSIMVIGFGTIGQKALLSLIMNGQFVGSRMRAIIVDREIEHLSEHFLHCYPALNLCCKLKFKGFDVRDKDFFKLLNENYDMDYIVVALNDDEENKKTALDIRLHYERKNKILPFIAVFEKNGSLHEVKQNERIFVFGNQEEIYKESVIIREKADIMAKTVNDVYKKMYGGRSWKEIDWITQESNRAAGDFIPAMLILAKLGENDVLSKDALTEDGKTAEILAQTEHLRWMAFYTAMGYSPISIDEMRQRFDTYRGEKNSRDHLDFCRRDTKARLHVCLASWDELDAINEAYRELAQIAGDNKEQKRNFKNNDRDIIKFIPKFLQAAKGVLKY